MNFSPFLKRQWLAYFSTCVLMNGGQFIYAFFDDQASYSLFFRPHRYNIISVLQTIRRSKVGNKCETKVSRNKIITYGYSIINTRHSIKCALKILHYAMNSRILNCRDYVLKYRISNV